MDVEDVEGAEFEDSDDYEIEDEEPVVELLDGEDYDLDEDDYESDEEPSADGEEDAW